MVASSSNLNIPDLLVAEIFPKVPLKSLMRYQAVCKCWKALLQPFAAEFNTMGGLRKMQFAAMVGAGWIHQEMLGNETVGETMARVAREEYSPGLVASVEKLTRFNKHRNTTSLWAGDISYKTKDEIKIVHRQIAFLIYPDYTQDDIDEILDFGGWHPVEFDPSELARIRVKLSSR